MAQNKNVEQGIDWVALVTRVEKGCSIEQQGRRTEEG